MFGSAFACRVRAGGAASQTTLQSHTIELGHYIVTYTVAALKEPELTVFGVGSGMDDFLKYIYSFCGNSKRLYTCKSKT